MAISKNDALRVAHLARIDLTEDELRLFARQLESIIEFIDKLKELDVSSVSPAAHTPVLKNVLRPDTIKDSLSKEAVLGNAPKSLKGHFLVPKVIE
ncbi:MAG: asparaginyl/glutamyl-tRNA amidotransferase subunit C [Omnitrophica WOR_2 bacterium RIFCSPHIGHO2_02_FULL_45_21]|nr:MAG: asparaginyl/glutamyl-tRNA amidotransferase subunit C [Omnitrophica WOR_2 bacterium RIFCSPHIGHO2_02_FULL_45_21]